MPNILAEASRRLLWPAAIIVLALCTMAMPSAQAFTDVDPSRVSVPDGAFTLTCHPLVGPTSGDRDPTVRVVIAMDLDADRDFAARSFEVTHHLWSGRTIRRDDQYLGRVSKEYGKAAWHWDGVNQRVPAIAMRGTLVKNYVHGWRYQEILFKRDRVDEVLPEVDCSLNGEGD